MNMPPDYRALADEGERYITDRTPINPWQAVQTRDDLIERMAIALRHAAQEREALEQIIAWCDERRDAPEVTTLGMVQMKLRAALTPTGGK